MMPFFGFPKKISWEKKRHSFVSTYFTKPLIIFYLDETPMGWFLEIEGTEKNIEEAIQKLKLFNMKRITQAYLGLWEDYKRENHIINEDMMF